METQLVISTVSEKYGHVSSLRLRSNLFIFITTASHHFSLSYYAFVFLTRLSSCGGIVDDGDRNRKEKHVWVREMLNNDSAKKLLNCSLVSIRFCALCAADLLLSKLNLNANEMMPLKLFCFSKWGNRYSRYCISRLYKKDCQRWKQH